MAILKTLTMPNHVEAKYHVVRKVEIDTVASIVNLTVLSYPTEEAFLSGSNPVWNTPYIVPESACVYPIGESVEQYLISTDTIFNSGQAIRDESITLEIAKSRRIAYLSDVCRKTIVYGFNSDALGATHHYPSEFQDQANLVATVLDSAMPGNPADWTTNFWCQDADGVWAWNEHTASQIQQVGRDSKAAVMMNTAKNIAYAEQVNACTDLDSIAAIEWKVT